LRLAVAIEEGLFFIIMKISELPEDVKKKALYYQSIQGDFNDEKSDHLAAAFDWEKTNEGFDYWNEWSIKKNNNPLNYFETMTNPYVKNNYDENGVTKPEQYQIGIDTFERAESNLSKEEILAICKFNIDKYNWRKKDQDKEDFKKIIDYANWAIKNL
jgi:hypothetical protein